MRLWNFGSCLASSCASCEVDQANTGTGEVQMIAESA